MAGGAPGGLRANRETLGSQRGRDLGRDPDLRPVGPKRILVAGGAQHPVFRGEPQQPRGRAHGAYRGVYAVTLGAGCRDAWVFSCRSTLGVAGQARSFVFPAQLPRGFHVWLMASGAGLTALGGCDPFHSQTRVADTAKLVLVGAVWRQ